MIQDENSRTNLFSVRIPWHWLTPFHQYHVKFGGASQGGRARIALYVSFMVKTDSLVNERQQPFYGLEVYVSTFDYPLRNTERVYTVVRFVRDIEKYKFDDFLVRFEQRNNFRFRKTLSKGVNQKEFGVRFKSVAPESQDFTVSQGQDNDSVRVSLASNKVRRS